MQPDVPTDLARRPSGILIDHRRCTQKLASRDAETGIITGAEQRVRIVGWNARCKQECRVAKRRSAEGNVVESHSLRVASADVIEARQLAIGKSEAGAKHRLLVDLVCNAEPRRNRQFIGVPEFAVAASGSGAFIDSSAQQSTSVRIANARREAAGPAPKLTRRILQIVSHTEVECQFTGNLPRILPEEAPVHAPVLRRLRVGERGIVHPAQQEARIIKTN